MRHKNILWFVLFGLAWGIFWWLSNLSAYDAQDLLGETGLIWFVPNLSSLLHKSFISGCILLLFVLGIKIFSIFGILLRQGHEGIEIKYNKLSLRQASILILCVVFSVYILFSLLLVHPNSEKSERYYLLTGDEPQYLLIANSFVTDFDFNLFNDVEEKDSLLFFDRAVNGFSGGVELFGPYAKGSKITASPEYWKNKRYSNLNYGLPILLALFYKIGMLWDDQVRLVIMFFINFLAAILVLNIFLLSFNLTKDKYASFIISLFAGFSMPIVFYSRQIFPDLPASLLLLYSFRKIQEKRFGSILKAIVIGICVGYMPWIHEKNILFSVILIIYFIYQWKKSEYGSEIAVCFFIPVFVSLVLQMRYCYLLFGVFYPVNMHPGFYLADIFKGSIGLLFDEGHGLIPYAPIYMISVFGIGFAIKDKQKIVWLLIFPVLFFLATACFREWWGGFCPAGRYMIPVVSFLVPFIAYAYYRIRKVYFRAVVIVAGLISIGVGIGGMCVPSRLYKHMHPFIPYVQNINFRWIFPNILENSCDKNIPKRLDRAEKIKIYDLLYNKNYTAMLKRPKEKFAKVNKNEIIKNLSVQYEAEELIAETINKVKDDSASNHAAVAGRTGISKTGCLFYGPYLTIQKGRYIVDVLLKTNNNTIKDEVAVFDIVSNSGRLTHGKIIIRGFEFKGKNEYQDFSFKLILENEARDIEFRLFYYGDVDIWADRIILTPVFDV
jgi:hypothetical protein